MTSDMVETLMPPEEIVLWLDAVENYLWEYEPFSDSEGQEFFIHWAHALIDEYQAAVRRP